MSLVVASVGASLPAAADASGGVITSVGPLTRIQTTEDLNCAVNHIGDSQPEFFGTTACATLIAADGILYGPADIPAGGAASPRTSWIPESQASSGSGTTQDPYRLVTVVTGGPLQVTQTDLYVVGAEDYSTRVTVQNTGSLPLTVSPSPPSPRKPNTEQPLAPAVSPLADRTSCLKARRPPEASTGRALPARSELAKPRGALTLLGPVS